MRDVETYLDRAEDALRLLDLAEGREAKLAILEIVRTWVRAAERRAEAMGLNSGELDAVFAALNRNVQATGAGLDG